jgi:hypothetical protein
MNSGIRETTHTLIRRIIRLVVGTGSLSGKQWCVELPNTPRLTFPQRQSLLLIRFYFKPSQERDIFLLLRSSLGNFIRTQWWSFSIRELTLGRYKKNGPLATGTLTAICTSRPQEVQDFPGPSLRMPITSIAPLSLVLTSTWGLRRAVTNMDINRT